MFSPCSIEKEEKQDEADIEIPTSLFEVWFVSLNIGV